MEIWKDIKNYEWYYQISNLGNVKSLERINKRERLGVCCRRTIKEKILTNKLDMNGYLSIMLCKDNQPKRLRIHRLIAEAFIFNLNNLPDINHKNWIKHDNRVENLERCTKSENMIHSTHILWKNPSTWKFWKDSVIARKIQQYTKEGRFIKERGSIREAAKSINRNPAGIIASCKWISPCSGWYKRKYVF